MKASSTVLKTGGVGDDLAEFNQEEHRDPFDRLLLATALVEGVTMISSDENFPLYVPLIRLIEA